MKIAIVGATGMLGHHAALAAVAAGHDVVVIHRAGSNLSRVDDIEGERRIGDLDDGDSLARALDGCDAVINAAGYYPTVPKPWRDEVERARSQMHRFYGACASVELAKIVYVGGSIALRRPDDGSPGREDIDYAEPPPGRNAYVQVKWAMDRMALDEAARGLPVVVGIPTMTFGEHDHGPTTGQLVVGVANRSLPGYIDGKRNVVYAGDAGHGLRPRRARARPRLLPRRRLREVNASHRCAGRQPSPPRTTSTPGCGALAVQAW